MTPSDTLKALCEAGDLMVDVLVKSGTKTYAFARNKMPHEKILYHLKHVEVKRHERKKFIEAYRDARPALKAYIERTERLEAENAKLKEALWFTPDPELSPTREEAIQVHKKWFEAYMQQALSGGEDE